MIPGEGLVASTLVLDEIAMSLIESPSVRENIANKLFAINSSLSTEAIVLLDVSPGLEAMVMDGCLKKNALLNRTVNCYQAKSV